MIKLSDFIARHLKEKYNISHVFLVSGGGAMHLNDSFGKYIPYSIAHNEQALSMMAEGYARVDQNLAVVNVTTGPGGLNCLNGVFGQWTDSVPVLYISGQVKYTTTLASCKDIPLRQLGDQEVDIISVVTPLTKYAVMITDPLSVKYHLDKAIYEATNNRFGPVWLDIPLDVQGAMIEETELQEFTPPIPTNYECDIKKVIEKLTVAKRPLIIAGHGIRLSKQEENFKKLLKKLNIPVVTTLNGCDIIEEDHPNYVARIGTVAQRSGNFALQNADCILCLGTRNNIRQISYNYENFAKNAYKIIVDIDVAELNKPTVSPDLKIHADLATFIPLLEKESPLIHTKEWITWCLINKEKYHPKIYPDFQQTTDKINPYFFAQCLANQAKAKSVIVAANGTAFYSLFPAAAAQKNQRWIWNSGDASMGYALPASIGAAFQSSVRSIICLEGDGSIMMNIQELQTIKHYNLPIKVFVFNNNGYISIIQTQDSFFDGRKVGSTEQSGVTTPDFCVLAEAFGLPSVKITSPKNLEAQVQAVLDKEGPVFCEVIINDNYVFSPKLAALKQADGTIISSSLENLSPFLDPQELADIMKISDDRSEIQK